jgi:short-subunit dehydrogenase
VRVEGRLVVVSGASSGIGAATARAFSAARARAVVLLARRPELLSQVVGTIETQGGRAHAYAVNLADTRATMETAERIRRECGEPDILINNAGAGRWLFPEETDVEEAVAMMAVPYVAAFSLTRAFLPVMLSRGSGHIVNITSPACFLPWPGATAYSAARWAMRGFSEALAQDLRGTGVDVSLVVPGKVSSSYFDANPGSEERIPSIARLHRMLSPEEVAAEILRAIERRRRLVVAPRLLQVAVWWARHFPSTVRTLLYATGARRAGKITGQSPPSA